MIIERKHNDALTTTISIALGRLPWFDCSPEMRREENLAASVQRRHLPKVWIQKASARRPLSIKPLRVRAVSFTFERQSLCIFRRGGRRWRSRGGGSFRRFAGCLLSTRLVLDTLRAAELLEVMQALDVVLAKGGAFLRLVRLACLRSRRSGESDIRARSGRWRRGRGGCSG